MTKDEIEIKIDERIDKAKLRTFASGKTGYGFYDKIMIDGKRHQVSLNVICLEEEKKNVR